MVRQSLRRLGRRVRYALDYLAWGGRLREKILLALLGQHYRSRFRRDWKYCDEAPHFFQHRGGMFQMVFGNRAIGLDGWYRGIYAAEVIRPGDCLLDIGCGDGFFSSRFFSPKCRQVDALDIEPTAIRTARALHQQPNIRYVVQDAVAEPFLRARYDVVVWDGAIGHFSAEVTDHMLAKIAQVLAPDGVFVGSEELGDDVADDHLQFFGSLDDLHKLLRQHFRYVELKSARYRIGDEGSERVEAYWRCAMRPDRLDESSWRRMPAAGATRSKAA